MLRGMIVVGLTGGLATGKSTVARLFQDCGATVIDADVLARQVVQPRKAAWRDLVRVFGPSILNPDYTVNRQSLATLVFRAPSKRRQLNAIVHPRVARAQVRLTRELARRNPKAIIIYDAPLLIESGAYRRMDKVIVVCADPATQIARLQRRNALTRSEAVQRIRAQMPLRKKIELADYVIEGTLPLPQLRRTVTRIYGELWESRAPGGRSLSLKGNRR
jgi:dephospho-CoA kinase